MATTDRLEISRLIHRFGFGPKPGEFAALVAGGVAKARQTVLTLPAVDAGAAAWSDRTKSVLRTVLSDPQQLVLIAINSPEYVVNA